MTKAKTRKVRTLKGDYSAAGRRFAIVVAQFNEYLTSRLLEGALDVLVRHGAREKDIRVVYVPGAFEIPITLKKLAAGRYDAILALAVVIRGQTRHFDQVVNESAKGAREVSLKSEVPVILGVVSADTPAQALQRVGIKHTNKGREWALSAIEMASLVKKLSKRP